VNRLAFLQNGSSSIGLSILYMVRRVEGKYRGNPKYELLPELVELLTSNYF
jgi:hypothetical protein